MQQLPGRRALALVTALAFATAGSAFAQDTTETGQARFDTTAAGAGAIDTAGVDTAADTSGMDRAVNDTSATDTSATDTSATDTSATGDTTETSGVQNPPGYRGMERDTTIFPAEGGPPATPEDAAGQTTGIYKGGDSTAGHDTTHQSGAGMGDTTAQTPDSAQ